MALNPNGTSLTEALNAAEEVRRGERQYVNGQLLLAVADWAAQLKREVDLMIRLYLDRLDKRDLEQRLKAPIEQQLDGEDEAA